MECLTQIVNDRIQGAIEQETASYQWQRELKQRVEVEELERWLTL